MEIGNCVKSNIFNSFYLSEKLKYSIRCDVIFKIKNRETKITNIWFSVSGLLWTSIKQSVCDRVDFLTWNSLNKFINGNR